MKSNIHPHLSFRMTLPAILATGIFAATLNAAPDATKGDPALAQQLADAQTKAAQLQGALAQNAPHQHAGPAASPMAGMAAPSAAATSMAGMGDDKMMAMMGQMMGKMDKMVPMMEKMMGGMSGMQAGGGMSGMDEMQGMQGMQGGMEGMKNMMGTMEGMDMMGMMSGMQGMQGMNMPQSALPGFPGASHIYHIGATGFFLDHQEHISLSTDQQVALNKIKEQALLSKSAAERQIDQAEQELAKLTSADQPDSGKIEAKVREIEKLRTNERLGFIRAVGEAAKLLTVDQRKSLTGFAPPAPAMPMTAPATSATPMPMNDM